MSQFTEQLAGVPLFSACSGRDLQRLARAADEVHVPAGTELTTQGGVGREAFVILAGTALVTKDGTADDTQCPSESTTSIPNVTRNKLKNGTMPAKPRPTPTQEHLWPRLLLFTDAFDASMDCHLPQ